MNLCIVPGDQVCSVTWYYLKIEIHIKKKKQHKFVWKHKLTQQVHSKLICPDVLKQGGEDGQQRHSHISDALADALHLGTGLHELAQF